MITQELLKELFDYKDGFLFYKTRPSNTVNIGDKVGYISKIKGGNRRVTKVNNKSFLCSRLIFLWHKGYLPQFVDHRDRNKLNDKIENLREASSCENNRNRTSEFNSVSKYLGVSLHNAGNSWRARIAINSKTKHLGSFKTEEAAALAYNEAAKIHHKEFANLNIININS